MTSPQTRDPRQVYGTYFASVQKQQQHHPCSVHNVTMDRYTPELSMLRLKRRRDDDVLSSSRLPRAKKVAYTPTGIFDFMRLSAGQYIYIEMSQSGRLTSIQSSAIKSTSTLSQRYPLSYSHQSMDLVIAAPQASR